ncbi:protoporphyrinogen/coproporphyrinogen oxidase [Leucobacter luti]|uniref:Oxygen-dependent protoporphyrinogen oxidase n=1 Tax=Leucobacter luti TaxID=340320 RepID=A0A4Q7TZ28_9MICO|nr:FAD-dependent oxidoreductase [Leucobacter luti]MBL3698523.1 FAD-binding protein [Leucobacter luti]RZT65897.1 oxygen-dependent protoporphyrinogen oxidase [Leucobacter luti]
MAAEPHVAVVGGGVSGLVAARELARAGVRVTLLEAAPRFGGRIRAAEVAGLTLDLGAEAFATRGGVVAALIAELGRADRIVTPAPLGSWLVAGADGSAAPLPPAGAMGIPAAPLGRAARRVLGVRGALRAACEPVLPRRVGRGSHTLAELVRARSGSRVLERLVRPVALGVSAAPPERIPLDAVPALTGAYAQTGSITRAARRLRESAAAAGGAVAGLRGGMTDLVTALVEACVASGVVLRTLAPVAALAPREGSGGARIAVVGPGEGEYLTADAVVLAVPEAAARDILGQPTAEAVASRVEVIALVLDATHPAVRPLAAAPRGTGALVAPADDAGGGGHPAAITAKALTHVTRKWPQRARPGVEVVRLSYGRDGAAPATAGLDDAAALSLALRDAGRVLGVELPGDAVRGFARQPWEMPARGSRAAPRPPAGVHLAGDWVSGVGFAAVIPAARELAHSLAATLTAAPAPFTAAPAPFAASTPERPER